MMNEFFTGHELKLIYKTFGSNLSNFICIKCNSNIQKINYSRFPEYFIYDDSKFEKLNLTCNEIIVQNIIEQI